MHEPIRTRLARVLADTVGIEPTTVVVTATFRDDLDVDSLTMVEVLMAMEEEFGVTLQGTEAARSVATVGDAVTLLEAASTQPDQHGPGRAATTDGLGGLR